jgi:hypothetical protein
LLDPAANLDEPPSSEKELSPADLANHLELDVFCFVWNLPLRWISYIIIVARNRRFGLSH